MSRCSGKLRLVQDAAVAGKTVLVRVDYNVPLENEAVTDDGRIRASLPTLEELLRKGAKIALLTHLGRPKGKRVPGLCLDPVAARLQILLDRGVCKLDDCVGDKIKQTIDRGSLDEVFMLENLRFHPEEEANSAQFAHGLASLGDVYVNDAFATLHRAHASTLGITHYLPSYAGMLVQKEINALNHLAKNPARPYVAIIGGKKAKSKLGALRGLLERVDVILIGGGVAFTFMRAKGYQVGDSVVDESLLEKVEEVIRLADEKRVLVVLPQDVVVSEQVDASAKTVVCAADKIPAGWIGLDIGPETIRSFREQIALARTVVWVGPMGAFELEQFSGGTREVGEALASGNAFTVVGGGETGAAVTQMGIADKISYISTGGGACLALLEGQALPALDALRV
ncbi:MAG: phosphoglycerate kinase [Candidatus Bipolaricaulota bacterium]